MGLGKTIQALAATELMAELFAIRQVLIISPTSLKHQWQGEIERFTSRTAQVIEGLTPQRKELYKTDTFYKLVNYELVARDSERIRAWEPDLIILDEAQRIKNWQTQIAKAVKQLESDFAIVLTGTPIENQNGKTPADMIGRFIERDEATGKSHLKIPLPEPAVMQSVFSGLEKLFAAFGGGGKGELISRKSCCVLFVVYVSLL